MHVYVYLDDWLITAPTAESLLREVQSLHRLVRHLGFIINDEKSSIQPSQTPQLLGSIKRLQGGKGPPEQIRDTVQ